VQFFTGKGWKPFPITLYENRGAFSDKPERVSNPYQTRFM